MNNSCAFIIDFKMICIKKSVIDWNNFKYNLTFFPKTGSNVDQSALDSTHEYSTTARNCVGTYRRGK